ncbi:unnamed protein product [Phytomonas sp. Hart1]|nr:unnamed protein product [Phytomonas sp. Hart1]|eukprot:CCW67704.1 unnamed protein product [Phytomonas sp. isolate Hart1]
MDFHIRALYGGGDLLCDGLGASSGPHRSVSPKYREASEPCNRDKLETQRSSASQPIEACVPRILFFGGDVVSLASLKALHTRMRRILCHIVHSIPPHTPCGGDPNARVEALVRDRLTVVCPSLPDGLSPQQAAEGYSRQFPIARYGAVEGLRVIPVDHPHSLAKSRLLREMLEDASNLAKDDGASTMRSETDDTSPLGWTWGTAGRPLQDFDLAIVVSFRYFLPERLLHRLPWTINMHPSLLPRYRGASPVFSTLMRNETEGGASVIRLPPGKIAMDSGDILWQRRLPIPCEMDIRGYLPLVIELGAAGLCEVVFGAPSSPFVSSSSTHLSSAITPNAMGDFHTSVDAPFCDWPRGFSSRLERASPQIYTSYAHFTMDPFHAPLLPRNAARLRFDSMSGMEAFGVWRAFVGGGYFNSCVNAILDKTRTPVRDRLLQCALRRFERKGRRKQRRSDLGLPLIDSPAAVQSPGDDELLKGNGNSLDQGSCGVDGSSLKTLLDRAMEELRLGCTFTMALNPVLVPSCVLEELSAMETSVHPRFHQPSAPLDSDEGAYSADKYCSSVKSNDGNTIKQLMETERKHTDAYLPLIQSRRGKPYTKEGDESCPGSASALNSQVHDIPPGSAYFPKCAEEIGAIKCRHAWFFWKQAHLRLAPRPQTADLLRKGLGMTTGVVYVGLFSEYS